MAKIPEPGDNVAIAIERMEPGTEIERDGARFTIAHTVLEGHRFAAEPIAEGEELSWGLPFGTALKDIAPGDYACNEKILRVLRERHPLGARARAASPTGPTTKGPAGCQAASTPTTSCCPTSPTSATPSSPRTSSTRRPSGSKPVPLHEQPGTFMGYRRPGGRGVGTRNHVVVLGVTSRTGPYAKLLEERLRPLADELENVDGVVAVAHTEGGEDGTPNNLEILLRALSGFVVHPNVAAVLVVDEEDRAVTGRMLRAYMEEHGYPLDHVTHAFMSLKGRFADDLSHGRRSCAPGCRGERRPAHRGALRAADSAPVRGLRRVLGRVRQPLIGWVAKENIKHGGAAVLAETDELIGAEPYVLQNVRDLETARRFLGAIARFTELVGWHGHTAEGNPSGGNNCRGLYNISRSSRSEPPPSSTPRCASST